MSELHDALADYLDHRRERLAEASEAELEPREATDSADEDDELQIAGVHARWPGVLALVVVLAGAAVYQADGTGRIRARDVTDGWLTPSRLSADLPRPPAPDHFQLPRSIARGVFAVEPVQEASGVLTLRAEPELEQEVPPTALGGGEPTPMSDAERTQKQAAYRAFFAESGFDTNPRTPAVTERQHDSVSRRPSARTGSSTR